MLDEPALALSNASKTTTVQYNILPQYSGIKQVLITTSYADTTTRYAIEIELFYLFTRAFLRK